MQRNVLSRLHTLRRLDVGFNCMKSGIDAFIGREAHIEMIDNENYMKMLVYHYEDLFI